MRELIWTQAETALMAPGPDVTARRRLVGELLEAPDNLRQIANQIAGADVRYDMGPATTGATSGWFVPDLALTTAAGARARVAELLREGQALLVDATSDHQLEAVLARRSERVTYVAAAPDLGHDSFLVRPDGYVAWSGSVALWRRSGARPLVRPR